MKTILQILAAGVIAFATTQLPVSADNVFKLNLKDNIQKAPEPTLPDVEPVATEPKSVEQPSKQPINVVATGDDKDAWMDAVGIPASDRYYVDCVINGCEGVAAEGGWHGTTRWNTAGSGAYGLCQALPASKMASAGADYMTNPITQLRWCHEYAQAYGGWQKAWEFRKCLGSCYSTRTGGFVNKDHTWW